MSSGSSLAYDMSGPGNWCFYFLFVMLNFFFKEFAKKCREKVLLYFKKIEK
jgi:hypothetical protein